MSLKFLADEDFNGPIFRGILRQVPNLDLIRVWDVGLGGADDATVLEAAAQQSRVVLSHDVNTMRRAAAERVRQGQPMPGLFLAIQSKENWAEIIDDIHLLAVCSQPGEWEGRERFLPLR